jgi:hypothetical protein
MRSVLKNSIGESIMYEFIDSKKIRLTCNKIKRHISYSNDVLIMYDFDGGPNLTKSGTLTIESAEYKIDDIKIINSHYDDIIELMIHIQ